MEFVILVGSRDWLLLVFNRKINYYLFDISLLLQQHYGINKLEEDSVLEESIDVVPDVKIISDTPVLYIFSTALVLLQNIEIFVTIEV